MKWLKDYNLFKESKSYSNKNLISEICISMILLNNEFLDSILDRGLKARYSENSQIFLTDLKNLLLANNRLNLGKFIDDKCKSDEELSKVNGFFDDVEFDIEKDWNILINARITARNIIDKLLPNDKITPEMVRNVFWIGPNKDDQHGEDIVLELVDGRQFSFYLNKSLTSQKTSSFNLFIEELIGENSNRLFGDEYLPRWNKLVQEWVRVIYENSNNNIQRHIEKFIDTKRIDSLTYFEYFDIKHGDPKYKHLGEFIEELNKNILKFQDLMSEIWKNKEICFIDPDRVNKEWLEIKTVILNSKIIESLLTTSIKTQFPEDIVKEEGTNFKLAGGTVKMKLFKLMTDKMGCLERPVYYLGNNGNQFIMIPSRDFFRKNYDDLKLKFDYHVNFKISEDQDDDNDFQMKIKIELDEQTLIEMFVVVKFSGSEMSGKLSSKYKFELAPNFNYILSKREEEL